MGAMASTFGNWLKAGLDRAVGRLKSIWEKACSLFAKVCDVARSLFESVWMCFSYDRERSYVTTEPGRVEVGRSEFHCSAQIGKKPTATRADPLPKDPVQREEKRSEIKEKCKIIIKATEELQSIIEEDENHGNMEKTSQALKDFYHGEAGRDVQKILDNQPTINPSLA